VKPYLSLDRSGAWTLIGRDGRDVETTFDYSRAKRLLDREFAK
jgi:hypothetical protein